MDLKNLSVIRQSFSNVVYTQRTHENSAEDQERKNTIVNILQIIFTSLILLTLILQFIFKKDWIILIGAVVTILEIILLIINVSFAYQKKALNHKKIALELLTIREKYIGLIADILNEHLENHEIVKKRDEILKQLEIIYKFAPQTTTKAYQIAQKRLNPKSVLEGEDFTTSDDEIDRFLPEELKSKNYKAKNKSE